MPKKESKENSEDASLRMQAVRYWRTQDNQVAFARLINVEPKRWNNVERGAPVSKDMAFLLVRKFAGLTTDWIFFGKEDGLPMRIQAELADALGKVRTSPLRAGAKAKRGGGWSAKNPVTSS